MKSWRASVAGLGVGVLALAACSTSTPATPSPSADPPSSEVTTAPAPEAAPPRPVRVARACSFPAPGRTFAIPGPDDDSWLNAVELGSGPDVGVYVHQSTDGLCGWASYADWAGRHGGHALLVDLCGWGRSVCSEQADDDYGAQLRTVVRWARRHGARRVTLVGASMGGAIVTSEGQQAGADALVALSSPATWQGVRPFRRAAGEVTVPFLVAAAASDTDIDTRLLRSAVDTAPAKVKAYLPQPDGHGWDMTLQSYSSSPEDSVPTRLGRELQQWVAGDVGAVG